MKFSDFLPSSWLQAHAAVTHFPIALLLVAVFFHAGALLLRSPLWRQIAFALLTLAVVSMPFALLSGFLTSSTMPRPPAQFDTHWKVAVATTLLAASWWIWQWKTQRATSPNELDASESSRFHSPQRTYVSQWAMLGLAGFCAMSVGYTGHLGGQMTLGTGDDSSTEIVAVASPTAAPDENRMEKIALAAGKMENAAGKLDVATDRLALASQNQKPAPNASPAPAPVINVAPGEVKVDASALDRAAANMDRVASRFESTAHKMETIAQQLQNPSGSPTSTTATKPNPSGGKPVVTGTASATPAPQVAAPQLDTKLIALGAQKYQDEELGCTGCHKMNGKGGRGGPDLTHAGREQPDIEWHIAHLKNPKSKVPGSSMPDYNDVSESDLRALATYLASLK